MMWGVLDSFDAQVLWLDRLDESTAAKEEERLVNIIRNLLSPTCASCKLLLANTEV